MQRFPPFVVGRCPGCGLHYLSPRVSEAAMSAAYSADDYFEGGGIGYSSYLSQERTLRSTFRRLLRELERRGLTGGALLEVGCAYGFFLDEAREFFSRRTGTDFSAGAAARARASGAQVVVGGLSGLPDGEKYDCAAAIHVIEHIYHPVDFLAELADRLRPGGTVLLAAPDMGSPWRRLLGRRWPFYKVPEHVSFFDATSMPRLLTRAGFVDPQRLPYTSLFPLGLIADKLGARLGGRLGGLPVWIPATSVAFVARRR